MVNKEKAAPSTGTMIVPKTKPLVLTRVKYSRLTISPTLRTRYPVNKDFVQHPFEKLEPSDVFIR
jgi:hypothetical protein